jgi:hypothetical protein
MAQQTNTGVLHAPSEFIDRRLGGPRAERIGFTGSRKGLTHWQGVALRVLIGCFGGFKEWHHGVCEGADEEGHFHVRELRGPYQYLGKGRDVRVGAQIHGWPPIKQGLMSRRAYEDLDVVHDAMDYKARDREIPWHTQALISCPDTDYERSNSGTYYTTRVALAMKRPIYLIRPSDGFIVTDWVTEMSDDLQNREYDMLVRHFAGRGVEVPSPFKQWKERVRKYDAELDNLNQRLAHAGLPTIEVSEALPDDEMQFCPHDDGPHNDPLEEAFGGGEIDPLEGAFG